MSLFTRSLLFLTMLVSLLLAGRLVRAQTPGTGGPEPDPDPTAVPLDGGAGLLLATGVAYGLRRLRHRRAGR